MKGQPILVQSDLLRTGSPPTGSSESAADRRYFLRKLASLGLLLAVHACVDYRQPPLTPYDPDEGTDAGADAGADGGADADAAVDVCSFDEDCVAALQSDICCSCARAVTVLADRLDPCLVPFPLETTPAPCEHECAECQGPACPVPDGAVCRGNLCVLRFPGECVDADDCPDGEGCLLVDGEARCMTPEDGCTSHDDCSPEYWCVKDDALGFGRCEQLSAGNCCRPEDCGDTECIGATEGCDVPGRCDTRDCTERGCPKGFRCEVLESGPLCLTECVDNSDCDPGKSCISTWQGAAPRCVDTDCSAAGGCDALDMFCLDPANVGTNECMSVGECVYDGHCARGERCEADPETGRTGCLEPYDQCVDAVDCLGGSCIDADADGFLSCQPAAGECTFDAHCPGAEPSRCVDVDADGQTECLPRGECQRSSECPEGQYCSRFNPDGRGTCVTPGAAHCAGTFECGAHEICVDVDDDGVSDCVADGSLE